MISELVKRDRQSLHRIFYKDRWGWVTFNRLIYLPNVNQNTALVLVLLGQYGSEANLRRESSTWILDFLAYAYSTILMYLHYYDDYFKMYSNTYY